MQSYLKKTSMTGSSDKALNNDSNNNNNNIDNSGTGSGENNANSRQPEPPKTQRPLSAGRRPNSKSRPDSNNGPNNDFDYQDQQNQQDDRNAISAGRRPATASARNRTADHQSPQQTKSYSNNRTHDDTDEDIFPAGDNRAFATDDSQLDSDHLLTPQNGYDPSDYGPDVVDNDVINFHELWSAIGRYDPRSIQLKPVLKSFLPDYIPAIGDIDPMIKIPQDNVLASEDLKLGIKSIDEPAIDQSDPTVIDLRLRAQSKNANQPRKQLQVRSIGLMDADCGKQLEKWCESVMDLHSNIQPDKVTYSKPMPSIETLMRSWDETLVSTEVSGNETLAMEMKIHDFMKKYLIKPTKEAKVGCWAELDVPLEKLAAWSCIMVDIPVHPANPNEKPRTLIESCHALFRLYLEFKNSNHFGKIGK